MLKLHNKDADKKAENFQGMKLFPPFIRIIIRSKFTRQISYGRKLPLQVKYTFRVYISKQGIMAGWSISLRGSKGGTIW